MECTGGTDTIWIIPVGGVLYGLYTRGVYFGFTQSEDLLDEVNALVAETKTCRKVPWYA